MSLDGEVSEKLRLVSPVTVDDGSFQSKNGGLPANAAGGAGGGPKPSGSGAAAAGTSSDLKISQLQVPGASRRRKFSSQRSSTSSVGKTAFKWPNVVEGLIKSLSNMHQSI